MSGYITFEERLEIESMIFQRCSFGEIAKKINKDRSTISREIRRHSVIEKSGYSGFGFNACVHKETCKMGMVCGDKCVKTSCKLCRTCGHCNDYCPKFAEQVCILRIKPPYVCNGCDERNKCTLEKTVYSAVQANIMAEQEISISRKGALCDEAEIARLNAFVTPLILNGQSVHQIYCNNADTLMCSEKTLYNYIDAGFFDARNIDLPRKVRYRPRRKKKEFKVDRGCYIGRSYEEYQKLLNKNADIHPAQMDSVIGTIGGKVLLTIHFPHTSFMMGFLRDFNTSQSVIDIFEIAFINLDPKRLTVMIMKTQCGKAIKSFLNQLFTRYRSGKWNSYDTTIAISYLIQSKFQHWDLLNIIKEYHPKLYRYYTDGCKESFVISIKPHRINRLCDIIKKDNKAAYLYFMYLCETKRKNNMAAFAYYKNFFDRVTADLDFVFNENHEGKKPNYKGFYKEKAFVSFYAEVENSETVISTAHNLRNSNPISHSSSGLIDHKNTAKELDDSIKDLSMLIFKYIQKHK
jgi:IS30 family transposase